MKRLVWLAIGVVLMAGCGGVAPSSFPPPSGSPSPEPSATASPVPSPAPSVAPASVPPSASISQGSAWHSVGPTTGLQDALGLGAVAWFKDRWVVFGGAKDGLAIWWSKDGIAWHLGDIRPTGSARLVTIDAIATNRDVAVAVGSWNERSSGGDLDIPLADAGSADGAVSLASGTGEEPKVVTAATCEGMASAVAAVLTSTDGASWTRVPDSRTFRGQPMLGVAVRGSWFVAAGGADGSGRSATWTSPDGRHWTRGPDDAALRAGWIDDVATFGTSAIAAGGSACGNEVTVPRAWSSADGRSWSLASGLFADSCCGSVGHVAVAGAIAVVDGSASTQDGGEPDGATWTSTDGSHWTLHPQPGQTQLGRLVATDNGFLAAGAGIWSSSDGVTWTELVSPDQLFGAIAVGPNGALATGDGIWTGPATAPLP